jgi:hypothetical protein
MGDGERVCLYSQIEGCFSSLLDSSALEKCVKCNGNGEAENCDNPDKYIVLASEKERVLRDKKYIRRAFFNGKKPTYASSNPDARF